MYLEYWNLGVFLLLFSFSILTNGEERSYEAAQIMLRKERLKITSLKNLLCTKNFLSPHNGKTGRYALSTESSQSRREGKFITNTLKVIQ